MLISSSGTLVALYEYDPWGKVLSVTGSNTTIGNLNPLRYRGYYYDTETGFYYLQTRYYDPAICRFINADGQINSGLLGTNLFAYCENNPVNRVDYTGQFWSEIWEFAKTFMLEVGNAMAAAAPAYAGCAEAAIADGPLPIGDTIGLIGATAITLSAVWVGLCQTVKSPAISIQEEKDATAAVESKRQAVFTINPYDFRPKGLIMTEYPGTNNGRVIVWIDPISQAKIFEWDEDLKYGSHYHAMLVEWGGNHRGTHYIPGSPVPEPWNSLYFGG